MQLSTLANQLIMQTIIRAILILSMAVFSAGADTLKTAVVTVAGASSVGNTITVNGTTRTAATAPTSFATQFATGSTATLAASNLAVAYQLAPAAGVIAQWNGAAVVNFYALPNASLTVTLGGGWGTISVSTQTITNATAVRVPLSVEGLAQQTNITSALVGAVGSAYNTNQIPAAAGALANFVNLSAAQVVAGAKNFSGGLSGTGGAGTNRIEVGLVTTNGQNFGDPWRSPGGGVGSEQFGLGASATTNYGLALGDSALASGQFSTAVGYGVNATNFGAQGFGNSAFAGGTNSLSVGNLAQAFLRGDVALGDQSYAQGPWATAVGPDSAADAPYASALGWGATAAYAYATGIGYASAPTAANQVAIGSAFGTTSVLIPGGLTVAGIITNAALGGTNTIAGDLAIVSKGASLVSGVNFLPTGTNTCQRITGPTGAFSVDQMDNGRDGRIIILENTTSYVMTIANNSGAVAGGAKIYTGTGAGVAVASSPGIAQLIYDSTLGYWVLMNHN